MPLRILIAPDKFKGTLTAPQAARAIAAGWRRVRPADAIETLPISDGGEGFGELLGRHLDAEERTVDTVDAAHRPIRATWWWRESTRTAIVESANIIGLAMLPKGKFHPFDLDTFGLGLVLRVVARARPRLCLAGIGGSATNDAGFGLARALGWEFRDSEDGRIDRWTRLHRLDHIAAPRTTSRFRDLVVAVDVLNPLLGMRGATRVYGPQKGIRPEDFGLAERCFRRLVRVIDRASPVPGQAARVRGAGAAGGLGFGLLRFAGARLESGFGIFADQTGLAARIRDSDLVLTGEGAIDRTSIEMGKGVGQVARLCRRARRPCLGLAGILQDLSNGTGPFTRLHTIAPSLTSPEAAMAKPVQWLSRLAEEAARAWKRARPT